MHNLCLKYMLTVCRSICSALSLVAVKLLVSVLSFSSSHYAL